MKSKFTFLVCFLFFVNTLIAKDYKASFFGIESNGQTMNTNSIQEAINYIHENGGGRLVFYVGRYLTGAVSLKSNVTIHLEEGAVLLGSVNPFDYKRTGYWTGLITALDQENIGITGRGIINGRGYDLSQNVLTMVYRGILKDEKLNSDRPKEGLRPQIIYFKKCKSIVIQDITLKNSASWVQQYNQCTNLLVDNITVDSKSFWNNDGIDVLDCDSVIIKNSYFDSSDDGICLKSEGAKQICQNVLIYNNTIRSSASGIKFGSYSFGGFKNIKIINNTVFDTYRSAITFATVDGGLIENIVVDSLVAINTGNVFFFRIGERRTGRKGSMKKIQVSNVYAEVSATKADQGYPYEGPIEHMPRNISPAIITGMPDVKIEDVTLKNIEIKYPGGGNPHYAKIGLDELDKVPERIEAYPEFSMFKELPAWGIYIRHASNIKIENVSITCKEKDYRTPVVLDDVHKIIFKDLKVKEPGKKKNSVFSKNSTDVDID